MHVVILKNWLAGLCQYLKMSLPFIFESVTHKASLPFGIYLRAHVYPS